MSRYFIVFYSAVNGNSLLIGHSSFKTDGSFLNYVATKKSLKESNGYEVAITNIIEVSEEEHKDWIDDMDTLNKE